MKHKLEFFGSRHYILTWTIFHQHTCICKHLPDFCMPASWVEQYLINDAKLEAIHKRVFILSTMCTGNLVMYQNVTPKNHERRAIRATEGYRYYYTGAPPLANTGTLERVWLRPACVTLYRESTIIKVRAANKHRLNLILLRFLHHKFVYMDYCAKFKTSFRELEQIVLINKPLSEWSRSAETLVYK